MREKRAELRAACGGETPQRAVYALAHDVEHDVVSGVCDRMLASSALPSAVADALGMPSTPGRTEVVWDRRICERRIAEGILENVTEQPRVADVVHAAIPPRDGVSEVAIAVLVDGAARARIPLVRYRGAWRVVVPAATRAGG